MRIEAFSFGRITIDGKTYQHDVVIDNGQIRKRDKGPSKELESILGHTPLSIGEAIPWNCKRLVVGTGAHGRLPVMDEVVNEAERRGVDLILKETAEVMRDAESLDGETNAILHVTC